VILGSIRGCAGEISCFERGGLFGFRVVSFGCWIDPEVAWTAYRVFIVKYVAEERSGISDW
jgi:hypothetical protein